MPEPLPPPTLNIPDSQNTVSVSIIDTTSYVTNIPPAAFMQPSIPGYDVVKAPCYSFLIKRNSTATKSKYDTLLFDLGVRKDWQNGPKAVVDRITENNFSITVKKNVSEILQENGQSLEEVGGIIWSHFHWDHTGDPSTFPPTTDLIVGPGFKSRFSPGYPTNPDSPVDESAWTNRNLIEITFPPSTSLQLGSFPATDFHGDGSLYLIDSPGHAIGHICALARVKPSPNPEFIILGGDIAHHAGEFRPTKWLPLPDQIVPNPLGKTVSPCPGHIFEAIHPKGKRDEPFMWPEGPAHEDKEEVVESVRRWEEFDAQENVFAVIAHDGSLVDVVEFWPQSTADEWRAKGWKREGMWRFLRDFDTGTS